MKRALRGGKGLSRGLSISTGLETSLHPTGEPSPPPPERRFNLQRLTWRDRQQLLRPGTWRHPFRELLRQGHRPLIGCGGIAMALGCCCRRCPSS